eukprot:gene32932-40651_t
MLEYHELLYCGQNDSGVVNFNRRGSVSTSNDLSIERYRNSAEYREALVGLWEVLSAEMYIISTIATAAPQWERENIPVLSTSSNTTSVDIYNLKEILAVSSKVTSSATLKGVAVGGGVMGSGGGGGNMNSTKTLNTITSISNSLDYVWREQAIFRHALPEGLLSPYLPRPSELGLQPPGSNNGSSATTIPTLNLNLYTPFDRVAVSVYERSFFSDHKLGEVEISLSELTDKKVIRDWFPLVSPADKTISWLVYLQIKLRFQLMTVDTATAPHSSSAVRVPVDGEQRGVIYKQNGLTSLTRLVKQHSSTSSTTRHHHSFSEGNLEGGHTATSLSILTSSEYTQKILNWLFSLNMLSQVTKLADNVFALPSTYVKYVDPWEARVLHDYSLASERVKLGRNTYGPCSTVTNSAANASAA